MQMTKRQDCQVKAWQGQLEQVDILKYLGVMISSDISLQQWVVKQTELKVVNGMVMQVLMYWCEAWAVHNT